MLYFLFLNKNQLHWWPITREIKEPQMSARFDTNSSLVQFFLLPLTKSLKKESAKVFFFWESAANMQK